MSAGFPRLEARRLLRFGAEYLSVGRHVPPRPDHRAGSEPWPVAGDRSRAVRGHELGPAQRDVPSGQAQVGAQRGRHSLGPQARGPRLAHLASSGTVSLCARGPDAAEAAARVPDVPPARIGRMLTTLEAIDTEVGLPIPAPPTPGEKRVTAVNRRAITMALKDRRPAVWRAPASRRSRPNLLERLRAGLDEHIGS